MKSKQEIYNNTVELIEKQEIEKIISEAYSTYKRQSEELEEIRELAYLDLVADNNGYNQVI